MVKRENFFVGMRWKRDSGGDLRPISSYSALAIEKLEAVSGRDMCSLTSVTLEEYGLWKRMIG